MKVEIKISPEITEPYAVLYSNSITDEIRNAASALEANGMVITAKSDSRIVVLQPREVFVVRVENDKTVIHCRSERYASDKRLYEMEQQLGREFVRISKATLVNLWEIASIEPSFNGIMLLTMKNGCKEYISRKYLPALKKTLGL